MKDLFFCLVCFYTWNGVRFYYSDCWDYVRKGEKHPQPYCYTMALSCLKNQFIDTHILISKVDNLHSKVILFGNMEMVKTAKGFSCQTKLLTKVLIV